MSQQSSERRIRIAIDGPAGSGKSTTAREVAKKLGYVYIDTGAMYRAVTLKVLKSGISSPTPEQIVEIAKKVKIELLPSDTKTKILIDDVDCSDAIRLPDVTNRVAQVAGNAQVRSILVDKQRELGSKGGVVMDGRDIGTVVFPKAELKIFMLASLETRAKRRLLEYKAQRPDQKLTPEEEEAKFQEVLKDIAERDRADETRETSPLKQAEDAHVIDTTPLTLEAQTQLVLDLAHSIIHKKE